MDKVHEHFRSFTKWDELGLELGLYKPTIEVIKKDKKDNTSEQNMEMLTRWLKMEDKVKKIKVVLHGINLLLHFGVLMMELVLPIYSIVKELRDKKVNDN